MGTKVFIKYNIGPGKCYNRTLDLSFIKDPSGTIWGDLLKFKICPSQ